jgi:hypothetical protein
VPGVVGQAQAAAQSAIAAVGLTSTVSSVNNAAPAGQVIAQNPAGGAGVAPGSNVALTVSLGPANVSVPGVVGQQQATAQAAIAAAGLTSTVTSVNNAAPAGQVIAQNPAGGASVPPGSGIALTVSLGAAADPTVPAGLVAAFNFDTAGGTTPTTAMNSANAVFNGTISGATLVAGQAGFGQALSFDGNDMVTVTDTVTGGPLDLGAQMTLSAWVSPSQLGAVWRTIVLKERGTDGLAYALYANDGPGSAQPAGYAHLGFDRRVGAAPALPLNTWTHVAVTRSGGTMQLYVNGALRATTSGLPTTAISQSNNPLRIGGNQVFGGEFFAGLLDDVRIYNRALSAAEIGQDRDARIQ